jgi:hypothetical protein
MKTRTRAALRAAAILAALALPLSAVLAQETLLPYITGTDKQNQRSVDMVGIQRVARIDTITATASGTLANSYVLDRGMTIVGTVTSGNDSVTLPTLSGAVQIAVVNAGAGNNLKVWPNCSTCQIDTGGNGVGKTVAQNKMMILTQGSDGLWYSATSP